MHPPITSFQCRIYRLRQARRGLLVLVLGALVGVCIGCFQADARADATLVVRNANVITVDANTPEAEAFAVDGDRFVRVGGESEVLELAGDAARVIDLGGRTVTPGFNDAHLHPVAIPPRAVYVGPPIVTVGGIVERLREAEAETPEGSWVLGWGYEDVDLGRHLDRHDLDAVSTDRPVMVIHGSLHVFAVNSRALVTAGVGADPGARRGRSVLSRREWRADRAADRAPGPRSLVQRGAAQLAPPTRSEMRRLSCARGSLSSMPRG